jgi:FKBP-type peptidyl-prolyl cis-trans isomerase (trigger factor)
LTSKAASRGCARGAPSALSPEIAVLEFNAGRTHTVQLIVKHYPALKYIDTEGRAVEATKEKIMSEQVGEDWMLFLE